jgi:hypothetical protein
VSAATPLLPRTDEEVLADLAHAAIGAFGWDTSAWPSQVVRHAWCLDGLREWSFPKDVAHRLVGTDAFASAWIAYLGAEADACVAAIHRAWTHLDDDERRRAADALEAFGLQAPTEMPPTAAWDVDRDRYGDPRP